MTEQTAPDPGATTVPEREIEFLGRQIWVHMPTPEQILVWQRTAKRLQNFGEEAVSGQQVLQALERLRLIIDSVIIHQVDKDWLDDEMLDRNITMNQAVDLIPQTIEAFAEDDNRASRRAAAKKTPPAKKAARKAAPRKAATR